MVGRDVLRGHRWRRVGVGTAAAQGGWEGRGMACVMLGAGAACVPTSGVRGVRQRWLGSAARSAKTAVMRGPKKCSRWSVRAQPPGHVSVRVMEPVVTRGAAARQWIVRRSCLGAAGRCSGRGAAACVPEKMMKPSGACRGDACCVVRVKRGGRRCGRGDDDDRSSIISSGNGLRRSHGDGACRCGRSGREAVAAAVAMKTTASAATPGNGKSRLGGVC